MHGGGEGLTRTGSGPAKMNLRRKCTGQPLGQDLNLHAHRSGLCVVTCLRRIIEFDSSRAHCLCSWYAQNAEHVWSQEERPSLKEVRTHAKCLRSTEQVRTYFRKYRAAKRVRTLRRCSR